MQSFAVTTSRTDPFVVRSATTYIALITCAVTVIALVAGSLGVAGSVVSWKLRSEASDAMQQYASIKSRIAEISKELSSYNALIECSYGVYRPTGFFLGEEIAGLRVADSDPVGPSEINRLIGSLAHLVKQNAIHGGHAVRLFSSDSASEVEASAMTLAVTGRKDAFRLVAKRVELEEQRANPQAHIIRTLSEIYGMFSGT